MEGNIPILQDFIRKRNILDTKWMTNKAPPPHNLSFQTYLKHTRPKPVGHGYVFSTAVGTI